MWHPFQTFVVADKGGPVKLLGVLTIICMIVLSRVNEGLHIVELEIAGSMEKANAIMSQWSATERSLAIFGTGFDYLFLFAYGLFLALAATRLASRIERQLIRNMGYSLAVLMLLAAGLDAVENYALLQIMLGKGSDFLAKVSRYCAIPKFFIVIVTMLYISIAALGLSIKRIIENAATQ